MEDDGFTEKEGGLKVNEDPILLISQADSGELALDSEMDLKHVRHQAQEVKREGLRKRSITRTSVKTLPGSSTNTIFAVATNRNIYPNSIWNQ